MSARVACQKIKLKLKENDVEVADGAILGSSKSGFEAKMTTRMGKFSERGPTPELAVAGLESGLKKIFRDTKDVVYTICCP